LRKYDTGRREENKLQLRIAQIQVYHPLACVGNEDDDPLDCWTKKHLKEK
jgi:hypothetical protein